MAIIVSGRLYFVIYLIFVIYHISAESWDSCLKFNYIQVTWILTPATSRAWWVMWMYFSVPKSFFWSQGFASLCPWLYWIFLHWRVTRSEVTPLIFHVLSHRFEVCLNVDPIQVSFPFLGSSWRVLASNKMTHIHGMIARVFYLFQRTLNSRHVFVKITDISLRKSLIPEVFLDCYCVARKRPIRSEKTMRQTNIYQVSTLLEIHFILRSARKSCLFF